MPFSSGARTASGKIHVQDDKEMKLRFGELAAQLGAPAQAADIAKKGNESEKTLNETRQLLTAKRDLWDRRDSSTPVAMVDLLKRIYKAELIKPESRNYLLDLMSRCATGKNRM